MRRDGDPVRSEQRLVIISDTELAPGQRAPAVIRLPKRNALRVSPTPNGLVTRRVVYLIDGLGPRAAVAVASKPCRSNAPLP